MAGEALTVIEGTERGTRLVVETELLLGRTAPAVEGRLGGDSEMSRRHARVVRGQDGQLTIEDLRSTNGTFVNGERVHGRRGLVLGDVVRVGRTALEVVAGEHIELVAELVVTGGPASGRRLVVTEELVLGRGVEGDGELRGDPELSRQHARVAVGAGGSLTVEDLGSANGTFVNGERVTDRRAIEAGDTVRIGSTTLEVLGVTRAADPSALAARPAPAPPPSPTTAPEALPASAPPVAPRLPPRRESLPRRVRRRNVPLSDRQRLISQVPLKSVCAGCRLEEIIGHGDMGIVYRADELALQRRVALKLILPEFSQDERFRERFRRESRVAAAIDHQNVIPIFDAGEENGLLYISMRLVHGTDLGALIAAEGALDSLRAARVVRQVGAALDAAHARGMVHRDVKPSNVLLSGQDLHVYLSDFGLAKDVASVGGMTRQESIIARTEYVAPEQIMNQRVDARVDVYALGCLLFEALTGEPPFARWTEGPQALAHLDAPRPSPVKLRPDLPRAFDEVVLRAMAVDPEERYPSAGDLGQAALVAAGQLRQAREWSVVATGAAAPAGRSRIRATGAPLEPGRAPALAGAQAATGHGGGDGAPVGEPAVVAAIAGARGHGADVVRWAVALAGLVVVAIGMLVALHGISTL